jgi:hypothetical protein
MLEHIAEVRIEDSNRTAPLLRISQRAPDCDMVLVHDNDLARLSEIHDNNVSRHPI